MGDDVEREEVGDAIEGDVGNAELGDEMEQLYKECNSIRNEDQWDFLLRLEFFFFFFLTFNVLFGKGDSDIKFRDFFRSLLKDLQRHKEEDIMKGQAVKNQKVWLKKFNVDEL